MKEWIEQYGDPRDRNVDPIDWIERIPFSETRNYVQRVIENMQVYRARLENNSKLLIEADLRRGGYCSPDNYPPPRSGGGGPRVARWRGPLSIRS